MKIGHNKPPPHQLETVVIEGIPVTLYKRSDLQNPLWQMRIKVPGSTKYVRQSTKCAKFDDAKEVALERYFCRGRARRVKVNAQLVEALEECSDWLEQRILEIIPIDDHPATQARIRLARTALAEAHRS